MYVYTYTAKLNKQVCPKARPLIINCDFIIHKVSLVNPQSAPGMNVWTYIAVMD